MYTLVLAGHIVPQMLSAPFELRQMGSPHAASPLFMT